MSLGVASLRALAHPVRLRILSLLTGSAMSAAEIARELGITQANASYHVRTLAAAGYLVEAGEEKVRGGIAKRYRYPPGHDVTVADATDPQARQVVYQALAEELNRRARLVEAGTRQFLSDAEFWVDEADWTEAMRLTGEASDLLHRHARPPRSPNTIHVSATSVMFRMRDEART